MFNRLGRMGDAGTDSPCKAAQSVADGKVLFCFPFLSLSDCSHIAPKSCLLVLLCLAEVWKKGQPVLYNSIFGWQLVSALQKVVRKGDELQNSLFWCDFFVSLQQELVCFLANATHQVLHTWLAKPFSTQRDPSASSTNVCPGGGFFLPKAASE